MIKTNRLLGNFSEYQLRGSQNRCFALPNFSFGKTTLNNNIPRLRPNSKICSRSEVQL